MSAPCLCADCGSPLTLNEEQLLGLCRASRDEQLGLDTTQWAPIEVAANIELVRVGVGPCSSLCVRYWDSPIGLGVGSHVLYRQADVIDLAHLAMGALRLLKDINLFVTEWITEISGGGDGSEVATTWADEVGALEAELFGTMPVDLLPLEARHD